ncbi:MAG: endonuclease/exonuclease/phosphatase family protein [Myxococcales bacterium]|nr:endonuclease/exonuclease/phosphatase family protein [Myxococcales bacterium]MCB9519344.1 endonuclease/exonuclease/phosphatase family protein [Myxococcales bacterium]MCB9530788.1 endonuclease/exonuclease/phosphatase family protein [Myxococcales bacterium]
MLRAAARALGGAGLTIGVLCTVVALATDYTWVAEPFANGRLLVAIALAPVALLLMVGRSYLRGLIAVAIGLWHAAPLMLLESQAADAHPVPADPIPVTVAALNLLADNADADAVVAWLAGTDADVIVLHEVTPTWARALARPELAPWPNRLVEALPGATGIALLSRTPLATGEVVEIGTNGPPFVDATVGVGGCGVRVLGVHTFPPVSRAMLGVRQRVYDAVAERAGRGPAPVAVGDWNATLYSSANAAFEAETGLVDVARRVGRRGTWLPLLGPLALDLDRAFVPTSWAVESVAVGPNVGSDHLPVLYRLQVPRAACVPLPSAPDPAAPG